MLSPASCSTVSSVFSDSTTLGSGVLRALLRALLFRLLRPDVETVAERREAALFVLEATLFVLEL